MVIFLSDFNFFSFRVNVIPEGPPPMMTMSLFRHYFSSLLPKT